MIAPLSLLRLILVIAALLACIVFASVAADESLNAVDPALDNWGATLAHVFYDLPTDAQLREEAAAAVQSAASQPLGSMTDLVDAHQRPHSADARAVREGEEPLQSEDASPAHRMRPLQASTALFNMTRRTAAAPFSVRIQPGLDYRRRELTYTQVGSGIRIRLGAGYLLMYEGGMTGLFNGSNLVENDVWVSGDDGQTWSLLFPPCLPFLPPSLPPLPPTDGLLSMVLRVAAAAAVVRVLGI